jgi:hypothetical protein
MDGNKLLTVVCANVSATAVPRRAERIHIASVTSNAAVRFLPMFPTRQLRRNAVLVAVIALMAFVCLPRARAAVASEAELKSVLLFHLSHYVEWPAGTNTQEFVIGILGPDPFGTALDQVVKGNSVNGRSIRVMRLTQAGQAKDCAIVYVSAQSRDSLRRLFDVTKNSPTLVVGETGEFMDRGGMIRFRQTPERKIRLQVNLTRVRERGLNVSAQLLRVSDVVQGDANR